MEMVMSRNELLRQIAVNTGVTDDLSNLNRNEILLKICEHYGINITIHTMGNYLRAIDSLLSLELKPIMARNLHLRSISSHFVGSDSGDNKSRNDYLTIWRDNVVPPTNDNQWPTGVIDFSLNIDLTKLWNFEV